MSRHVAEIDYAKSLRHRSALRRPPRHAAKVDFTKSPLDRNTLRLQDLFVGQMIVRFHMRTGVRGHYQVMQMPITGCFGGRGTFVPATSDDRVTILVLLRDLSNPSSTPSYASTADLGITTYRDGRWSGTNCVVDVRWKSLLPAPDPKWRTNLT